MSKPFFNYIFLFFSVSLLFSGCDTIQPKDCKYTDWYELGRQNGSKGGSNSSFQDVVQSCENVSDSADNLYKAGYSAGIVQYCSDQSAFEIGKSGQPLPESCLNHSGDRFNVYYQSGRRVLKLEKEKLQIENNLQSLKKDNQFLDNQLELKKIVRKLQSQRAQNLKLIDDLKATF